MTIDEDVIANVLSRKKELESNLKERQKALIEKSKLIEENVYDSCKLDVANTIGDGFTIQIRETFGRQQKVIQEELIYIQKQQAIIDRIYICFEALPFALKEVLEKLYVQQQKWDAIELSRSTISYRKRKATQQILTWYHSEMTDIEIINEGQWLKSGMKK